MRSPEFKIADARKIVDAHDLQAVVVALVERDGTVRTVTYGEDKRKCDAIGWWGQGTVDACLSIVPFRTIFGWGNRGVPQPLSRDELAQCPPSAREFAQ